MKTAIKSDFFANFPSLKKDEVAQKIGATEEERMLYGMSQTAGWRMFSTRAEELLKEMDSMNELAVSQGMSYEDLGKNTVVVTLAKGIIRKLLNMVSDSKEACEPGGE